MENTKKKSTKDLGYFRESMLMYNRLYSVLIGLYILILINGTDLLDVIPKMILLLIIISFISAIYLTLDYIKNKDKYKYRHPGLIVNQLLVIIINVLLIYNM